MVREGDQDAAAQLYDRYARRVFGLVRSKLGAKLAAATEPDDIVQSVFRSVFRGMQAGHYDAPPGETLWNLLAVIAVRKLASKATHFSAKRRDIGRTVPIETDAGTLEPHDRPSMEFLRVSLSEILETLRPIDREILSLRIENHGVDEISVITGRAKRTVERSLQNSRRRLANLLLHDNATPGK